MLKRQSCRMVIHMNGQTSRNGWQPMIPAHQQTSLCPPRSSRQTWGFERQSEPTFPGESEASWHCSTSMNEALEIAHDVDLYVLVRFLSYSLAVRCAKPSKHNCVLPPQQMPYCFSVNCYRLLSLYPLAFLGIGRNELFAVGLCSKSAEQALIDFSIEPLSTSKTRLYQFCNGNITQPPPSLPLYCVCSNRFSTMPRPCPVHWLKSSDAERSN